MRKIVAVKRNDIWILDSYVEQMHIDKAVNDAKDDSAVTRIIVATITSDYIMEWVNREETKKTS